MCLQAEGGIPPAASKPLLVERLPGPFVLPAVAVFVFSFIAGGCLEFLCLELAPVFLPPKKEVDGGFCIAKLDQVRSVEENNHFYKRIINLENAFLGHDNFTYSDLSGFNKDRQHVIFCNNGIDGPFGPSLFLFPVFLNFTKYICPLNNFTI
jgi:hypothetical protein